MFILEVLRTQRDKKYIKLSDPEDIDRFFIDGIGCASFSLLYELGIPDYEKTFKTWLRNFPTPIFIICAADRQILGWVYGEEWTEPALDGEPVYVLRTIETAIEDRGKGIGYRLLILLALETPGYLITKPINDDARKFFFENKFIDKDEMKNLSISLDSHPGYLVLPPYKKRKLVDDSDEYFD